MFDCYGCGYDTMATPSFLDGIYAGGALMQTFMLAPQGPEKYYIHNNIFRYQDEVFMEAAGDTSTGITKDKIREVKKTTF